MTSTEAAKKQEDDKPADPRPQQIALEEDDEFEEFSTEGASTSPSPSRRTMQTPSLAGTHRNDVAVAGISAVSEEHVLYGKRVSQDVSAF